jgi:anti-anti-sigma factor
MADDQLPRVELDQFRARTTRDGGTLQIAMTGTADSETKPALDELFARIHEVAIAGFIRTVVVDLRALEFMNSSSLKAFLTWFRTLREGTAPSYKVELRTSPEVYWQRRSIQALVAFAPDHVTQIDR